MHVDAVFWFADSRATGDGRMDTLITIAYRWMLFWLRRDLVIGMSTGRSPDNVRQIRREIEEYELLLLKHELTHGGTVRQKGITR